MSIDSIPCDIYVDISGTDCTEPFSSLSDALSVLQSGQTLMAVSAKQALKSDVPAYCQQHNIQLVDQGEADGMVYFLMSLAA